MTEHPKKEDLIQRPDGSYVAYDDMEPRQQLAHDLVMRFFPEAEKCNEGLARLKAETLSEIAAFSEMMMNDHGVTVGGAEGNITLRSICGRFAIRREVAKSVTFGPELEAAKALISKFLEEELEDSRDTVKEIVGKVFKLNGKGRVDTYGILGLREHRFEHPLWRQAMDAIEKAIIKDTANTYVRWYRVDPQEPDPAKRETRLPLDMAKV
ncbi:DUF3164 family protein [Phaeobacter sp. PT47_59]|uniref:DUF3164 family protein n=1 Tax=Phaeobacter sp. PT47_59 TaxID=3029979 RepID=UPI00237FEDF7|nr:DUF3164 family protein [Phaeobacter sp. PT47_59]MDE4175779.1 DUF3164 family protein [Phaeobacter sp. PT47_59]